MKKLGILILSAFIVVLCASCQGRRAGSEDVLTVCVDAELEQAGQELIDTWEYLHDGEEAKLIIIPKDSEMSETRITELRTEIMSGEGPDVFLLFGMNPNWSEDSKERSVLFSNPEKAMNADAFLPLDEYLEEAQYLDTEEWNPAFLESGRTEEGQMFLPVCYEYGAYAFRTKDIESAAVPSSWEELSSGENEAIVDGISGRGLPFYNIFGGLVDYQEDKLLFSEEELSARLQEAISFMEQHIRLLEEREGDGVQAIAGMRFGNDFVEALKADREEKHSLCGFSNVEGGMTANVTIFAAINRNTEWPEEAFSLLDVLFSDEVMGGNGFADGDKTYGSMLGADLGFYGGMPVSPIALEKACEGLTEEDREAIEQMMERIDVVRCYSDLDKELQDLYEDCYNHGRILKEEQRNILLKQTLDTIKMKLSE